MLFWLPKMNTLARRALLPACFAHLLPPEAGFEAATVERLMAAFAAQGYVRVKPPLLEFEDALLSGSGAAMARHSFRLMDPVSQRMLALRPDMTLQVARIAAVRLRGEPRPLRLCYAGQVVRVVGDALRPARQFGQIGCELIGASSVDADAEAALLAASALLDIGTHGLCVDVSSPTLAGEAAHALGELLRGSGDVARGVRGELDCGGRYLAGGDFTGDRLHALHRHDPARAAGRRPCAADLPAARDAAGARRGAAQGRMDDRGRARPGRRPRGGGASPRLQPCLGRRRDPRPRRRVRTR